MIDNFDRAHLSRRALLSWCALLWLFGFALFAKSIGFGFMSLDTETVLLNHPKLYDETSLLNSAYQILFAYFPREEPLIVRDLTWALDSRLFGFRNPLGYHLGNVILHACNCALVFVVIAACTRRAALALGSALLFTVLPIHVQPVSWEMGRKDVLVALFMLVSVLVQNAALRTQDASLRRRLDLLLVLLCALAMLAKFSAIVLCVLLALHRVMQPYLDGSLGPRASLDLKSSVRRGLPLFAVTLVVSLVLYRWYSANLTAIGVIGSRGPAAFSAEHLHTLSRYVPLSLATNLKLIFVPFNYSIIYQYPNTNLEPQSAELAFGYAVSAALVLLTLWLAVRQRAALFVVLAFGVLLVPYANIEYIGYWVADRYLYLAALCPIVLVVGVALAGAKRYPRAGVLLSAGVFMFYASRTYAYQDAYRDNLALWRYETALPKPSVWAFASLTRETLRRATDGSGPERNAWIAQTKRSIEQGLALFRSLPLKTTSYRMTERLHAATMHLALGKLAALEHRPLEEQLRHYRDAHALAITPRSALLLAEVTLKLAGEATGEARARYLHESFGYFAKHLRLVEHDQAALEAARPNFMVYARFPELEADMKALLSAP